MLNNAIIQEITIGNCRLIHGDCLDVVKLLPQVDSIVTDPPYNLLGGNGFKGANIYKEESFRAMLDFDVEKTIPLIFSVQNIVNSFFFCSRIGLKLYLMLAEKLNLDHDVMVWCKTNPIPFKQNTQLASDIEYIVRLFTPQKGQIYSQSIKDRAKFYISAVDSSPNKPHPTIKPLPLIKKLCRLITQEGGLVLDPFMGSGTTAIACASQNIRFIGIEKEEKYFNLSVKRVREFYSQPSFFDADKD